MYLNSALVTLLVFSLSSPAVAEKGSPPTAPGLTHIYTLNIIGGDQYMIGDGPKGNRFYVPIVGGNFSGPSLQGAPPVSNSG